MIKVEEEVEVESDFKLYLIETESIRSIWIKETPNQLQLLRSELIPISSLTNHHQEQDIQVKEASLSSSSSVLSVLINNHQIIQIKTSSSNLQLLNQINLPSTTDHEAINTISSTPTNLIFSSNSHSYQFHSNTNTIHQLENNLGHHHSTIQHLIITQDPNLIISSSLQNGVIVYDQLNQSNHKLNIKSKSTITSISLSSFSSKLFTINLESKILLFDLNLHLTKPITAFKLNSLNQKNPQPILVNAHFSNLNSNLIIFLNQVGQIGLGDLTHHNLISQMDFRLDQKEIIKLSSFSSNGKTLVCLTNQGNLISKDLKTSFQTHLLNLSFTETQACLRLLFQPDLNALDPIDLHTKPRSRPKPKPPSQNQVTPKDLKTETQGVQHDYHSSSSISTLISPQLKPISSKPKSKKEFELGIRSEARVSTLVSKLDVHEPLNPNPKQKENQNEKENQTQKENENQDQKEKEKEKEKGTVNVSVKELESIIDRCVKRSIDNHYRMVLEKFEELKLEALRQGFRTREEIGERLDRLDRVGMGGLRGSGGLKGSAGLRETAGTRGTAGVPFTSSGSLEPH